MIRPNFEMLGLTETEGTVYLSVLELGGGYVSTIARHAKLPRVNCYHTLENLTKKGLVTYITKDNVKYFSAEPPQKLLNMQEEKFAYTKKLLPDLMLITSSQGLKPKIKYFEGKDAIKGIFEDMATAKKEILGYSNLKALTELFGDFIFSYADKKMKKGIKTRIICPLTAESTNYVKNFYPKDFPAELIEIIYVNPREFWFEHEIMIYDDKVAVISLNPEELIGMIFESPVYARSQRAVFNLAWLGATSFIAT